jgi:hypothetical protein
LSNAGFDVGTEYRQRCIDEAMRIELAKLERPSNPEDLRKVVDQTNSFKSCYAKASRISVVPVKFQFTVVPDIFSSTLDQKTFTLSAWDWEPWRLDGPVSENRDDEDAVLALIYH